MQAEVQWQQDEVFLASSGSGHQVVFDCSGSGQAGPSPMETLIMSLAGCAAVDVVHILKKARQSIHDLKIQVQGDRRDSYPRSFKSININFQVFGDCKLSQAEKAVALSLEKYCSVAGNLQPTSTISHSVEVLPSAS